MAQQVLNNGESGLAIRNKINENFSEIYGLVGTDSAFSFVNSKDDFPDAVAGVITLPAGSSYYITTSIDLEGDRISCAGVCALIGSSAEISILTSTGLDVGTPLLSSGFSINLSRVQIQDVGTAVSLNASSNIDQALDWSFVNFLNVETIGTITSYGNFVSNFVGILNSSQLTFAGTIGTISFSNSIFNTDANGTAILVDSGATISRRLRISDSAFVTLPGEFSLNVPLLASVPIDGYILNGVSFSGGGTYLVGIQTESLESNFSECTGINNSTYAAGYSMQDNAVETVIAEVDTPVKIAGTTVANSINQKFSHSNNRLTYVGINSGFFKFDATISFTAGNNKRIGFYVAKNGVVIDESEIYRTTSGTNNTGALSVQALADISTGDYLEIWTENVTDTTNVTALSMTPIVTRQ